MASSSAEHPRYRLHLTLLWAGMASRNVLCPLCAIRTHAIPFPKSQAEHHPRPCSWPHPTHFWCQHEASQGTKLPFPIHRVSEAGDQGLTGARTAPVSRQHITLGRWKCEQCFLFLEMFVGSHASVWPGTGRHPGCSSM